MPYLSIFLVAFYVFYFVFKLPTTYAQSSDCSGTSFTRADGLVSTPSLNGTFNTSSGRCVTNEARSAFVSYKLPSYDDLKSIYYTQSKAAKAKQLKGNSGDYIYLNPGALTIDTPSDITGNNTGLIFVDGKLNITKDIKNNNSKSGIVFLVKEDVVIDPAVSQIDAVIISSGTIYTAGDGCLKNSVSTSNGKTIDQLVINGSLISLSESSPIKFCRIFPTTNTLPAEVVNQQPKYLAILKDIFSDTLQKWTEVTGPVQVTANTPTADIPVPVPPPPPPPPSSPCADNTVDQTYTENTMAGCDGSSTYSSANSLCGSSYHVCSENEYAQKGGNTTPATANRWLSSRANFSQSCPANSTCTTVGNSCYLFSPSAAGSVYLYAWSSNQRAMAGSCAAINATNASYFGNTTDPQTLNGATCCLN